MSGGKASLTALAFMVLSAGALTQAQAQDNGAWAHENGIGADPDNDANPATDTGGISISGDGALLGEDAPYAVINFEAPPGRHGEALKEQYRDEFGVFFGDGLTRQVCQGQRRFAYDSICTYEAAPSGAYAAGYHDPLNRPLIIEFDRPVCVAAMAVYPTGGKEGEPFKLNIDAWDSQGRALTPVEITFEWTKQTVRWRHMAGAYYLGDRAAKISIRMQSLDRKEQNKILRFLIDDIAMIEDGCEEALRDIAERAQPQEEPAEAGA